MIQTMQEVSIDGVQWDAVVRRAHQNSGVEGTVILGADRPVAMPLGLPGLLSALLQFLAPEAPRRLRVCTYHLRDLGCVLEVRGGRELSGLPEVLTEMAGRLGVKVRFFRPPGASVVLLSLPSQQTEN